ETVFQPQNDATNGILTLDMTSLGQTEGVSGSGVLAEITFTVKNAGDWAMEAVEIVALDSQLQRIEGIALQGLNGTAKHPTRPNIPTTYHLAQNHPNPFNPVTAIRYQLPQTQAVNLRIYDVSGRLVRALVENEIHEAGYYVLEWDGTDDAGQAVSSGMYIYQFDAGPFSQTRQMLLVK
ncbi:MAG: T9SS C-terminal target domain-containing protein, partial [Gemmatimonadetes bacterium]